MLRKCCGWCGARLSEPSTWAGFSMWCLTGAAMTFTWWANWQLLFWAAGIAATVAVVKAERGGR